MLKLFKLNQVTFQDGYTAEGSFEFNTDTLQYNNILITVFDASQNTVVTFKNDDVNSSPIIYGTNIDLAQKINGNVTTGSPHLKLTFSSPLTEISEQTSLVVNTSGDSFFLFWGSSGYPLKTGEIIKNSVGSSVNFKWNSSGGNNPHKENNPCFTFILKETATVKINLECTTMNSSGQYTVDTCLYLLDINGNILLDANRNVIGYNDDGAPGITNSKLTIDSLPSGTYKIVAASYYSGQSGEGLLKVNVGTLIQHKWNRVAGFLKLEGDALSNNYDTHVPEGFVLASQYDIENHRKDAYSFLENTNTIRLTNNKAYIASRFGENNFFVVEKDPTTETLEYSLYILYEKQKEENLKIASVYWESSGGRDQHHPNNPSFTFIVEEETNVEINLESTTTNVDTYLYLLNANGEINTIDDDGGEGRNSKITITDLQAGTYKIVAATYNAEQSGHGTLKTNVGTIIPNELDYFSNFEKIEGDALSENFNTPIPERLLLASEYDIQNKKEDAYSYLGDGNTIRLTDNKGYLVSRWGENNFFIVKKDPFTEVLLYSLYILSTYKTTHYNTIQIHWTNSEGKDNLENNPHLTFVLKEEKTIDIALESKDLNSYLYLLNANGVILKENNHEAKTSRIIEKLPAGTYTIVTAAVSGEETHKYGTLISNIEGLITNEKNNISSFLKLEGDALSESYNTQVPEGFVLASQHDIENHPVEAYSLLDGEAIRLRNNNTYIPSSLGENNFSVVKKDPNIEMSNHSLYVSHSNQKTTNRIYYSLSLTQDPHDSLNPNKVFRVIVTFPTSIISVTLSSDEETSLKINGIEYRLALDTGTPSIPVNNHHKLIITLTSDNLDIPELYLKTKETTSDENIYIISLGTDVYKELYSLIFTQPQTLMSRILTEEQLL